MKKAILALASLLAAAASGAAAQDLTVFDQLTWSATAGTLGPGIEAGYRIDDHWGVRGSVNALGGAFVYHDNKSDMPSQLLLLSTGLTADYYPYAGDFRLSGGVRLSGNRIDGKLKNLEGKVKSGSSTVSVLIEDPLTKFTVTQNLIQPYLGAGYSFKVKDRVTLDFDLGALYTGTPDLSVQSRAGRFGFTHDQIRREVERARDRLAPFKVYPVVQVGLNFRF
jgi:hypothetical protein